MLRRTIAKAWPYIVTAAPSVTPVTLAETKTYLKVDGSDEDSLITTLINAATTYAEGYMKRDLITRTHKTLRNSFADCLTLRRSPAQSVVSVKHKVDGVQVTVTSDVYFLTEETAFSSLSLNLNKVWPTNTDNVDQAVEIIFKSGFGNAPSDVPEDIRTAILQHIAAMHANRGDCSCDAIDASAATQLLPIASRLIYDMKKIRDVRSL